MNKTLVGVMSFALGAAAGAAGAWYILKTRYEEIAQEEIDSVKQVFKKRLDEMGSKDISSKSDEPIEEDPEKSDGGDESVEKEVYKQIIDYTGYSATSESDEKKDVPEDRPYVIPPDAVGELVGYDYIELIFFSDNTITDDQYELLENPEDVIGFESLNHFGEYEEDSVYVRNDRLKCDYAILLDERTYEEAVEARAGRKGVL